MKRQLISTRMIRKGAILWLVWISFLGCLTQLLVNGFINFYHAISRGKINCKIYEKKTPKISCRIIQIFTKRFVYGFLKITP